MRPSSVEERWPVSAEERAQSEQFWEETMVLKEPPLLGGLVGRLLSGESRQVQQTRVIVLGHGGRRMCWWIEVMTVQE